jgi:hypothetical protein
MSDDRSASERLFQVKVWLCHTSHRIRRVSHYSIQTIRSMIQPSSISDQRIAEVLVKTFEQMLFRLIRVAPLHLLI